MGQRLAAHGQQLECRRGASVRMQLTPAKRLAMASHALRHPSTHMWPFRSQNVVNLHTYRNVNKTRTIVNFDPVGGWQGGIIS